MSEQRVSVLPVSGVTGVVYVVEPGNASYTWDDVNTMFVPFESRPVTIPDPRRFGDNPA